jgi:hypothetical protein
VSLTISGLLFTGPNPLGTCVVRSNHTAAVFAIISKEGEPWDPRFRLLWVGDTGPNGQIFADHSQAEEWLTESKGKATVFLLPVNKNEGGESRRQQIITEVLSKYTVPNAIITE